MDVQHRVFNNYLFLQILKLPDFPSINFAVNDISSSLSYYFTQIIQATLKLNSILGDITLAQGASRRWQSARGGCNEGAERAAMSVPLTLNVPTYPMMLGQASLPWTRSPECQTPSSLVQSSFVGFYRSIVIYMRHCMVFFILSI